MMAIFLTFFNAQNTIIGIIKDTSNAALFFEAKVAK